MAMMGTQMKSRINFRGIAGFAVAAMVVFIGVVQLLVPAEPQIALSALPAPSQGILVESPLAADDEADNAQHPLDRALDLARESLAALQAVDGYTAKLVKRERIGSSLAEPQELHLKLRHEPFSVYLKFLSPSSVSGREVIYVASENDGKLLVHLPGLLSSQLGTMALDPRGFLAMQGERHSIEEIGLANLTRQLIERGEHDRGLSPNMEVRFFEGAKVGDIETLRIEVSHPEYHKDLEGSKAVIYFDTERKIPLRYEGYGWPAKPGDELPLMEEYTYLDVQLNPPLDGIDFRTDNPEYRYP